MVDEKLLQIKKKNNMISLLDLYFDLRISICDSIEKAIKRAELNFHGQILNEHNNRLRALIDEKNKNSSATGFLIDMALYAIGAPLVAQISEAIGKGFFRRMVDNRTREVEITAYVLHEIKVRDKFVDYSTNIKKFSEEFDQDIIEIAAKRVDVAIQKPLQELRDELKLKSNQLAKGLTAQEFYNKFSHGASPMIENATQKVVDKLASTQSENVIKDKIGALHNKKKIF